jgi:hypothetical protein
MMKKLQLPLLLIFLHARMLQRLLSQLLQRGRDFMSALMQAEAFQRRISVTVGATSPAAAHL